MTGFGAPCGACKILRRKCTRSCIFAPYFCQEESATHFAAIHKVFGASSFSKLLTNLPVSDRYEAAVSISYEAQARVQDPIYGCVSHIFALQQQVVNLEAQLALLKAQAAENTANQSSYRPCFQEEKSYRTFPPYISTSAPDFFSSYHPCFQEEKSYRTFPPYISSSAPDFFSSEQSAAQQQFHQDPNNYAESTYHVDEHMDLAPLADYHHNIMSGESIPFHSLQSPPIASHDMHTNSRTWGLQDAVDLQSVAFPYLQNS